MKIENEIAVTQVSAYYAGYDDGYYGTGVDTVSYENFETEYLDGYETGIRDYIDGVDLDD